MQSGDTVRGGSLWQKEGQVWAQALGLGPLLPLRLSFPRREVTGAVRTK